MVKAIGETAGRVWKFLDQKGEATLSQIQKGMKGNPNLVLQAIGWLAREDKLEVKTKGRFTTYTLKR
jgi:hypothetical protein